MTKRHFNFGQASHKGTREYNEDAALSLVLSGAAEFGEADVGLFIVADGLGRKGEREKAATLAVQTIGVEFLNQWLKQEFRQEGEQKSNLTNFLISAFEQANKALLGADCDKCGAVATAALLVGTKVYVGHIGTTKAYLFSKGSVEHVTAVHDFIHKLIELGHITWEDYRSGRATGTNPIYRALGQNETVEISTHILSLEPGSALLLCTNGIWWGLSDNQMQEIINHYSNTQTACEQLVSHANNPDMNDCITAILVKHDV